MIFVSAIALLAGVWAVWLWVDRRRMLARLRRLTDFISGQAGADDTSEVAPAAYERLRENIVAQTRRLKKLTLAGDFLGQLLDELDKALVFLSPDHRVKYWNKAAARMFPEGNWEMGASLIQVTGDHRYEPLVREAGRKMARVSGRILMAPAGGESVTYLAQCGILEHENGSAEEGVWMMVRDISEQERADQVRKDFVANASHELRTPLTLIRGYLELLLDDSGDRDAVQHAAGIMWKHSVRLERIVEDMLMISRLENAGSALSLENFSFAACVNDVVAHVKRLYPDSQAEFEIDLDEGERFYGDRFLWEQVLSNLLENAVKENTGRALAIRVSLRREDSWRVVRIRDNGVGIARVDLPHIFRRFYRGAKNPARKGVKGTGLGLSIVRHAVEAQGGKIEAASDPGLETVFTMRMPLEPAGIESSAETAAETEVG